MMCGRALLFIALALTGPYACEAAKAKLGVRSGTASRSRSGRADPDYKKEGVTKESKNNMVKVVKTLEDIVASIVNSGNEEAKAYGAYKAWCTTELTEKGQALDSQQFQNEEAANAVKELVADESKIKHDLDDTGKAREEAKDMVEQANNMRDEESAKYDQDMTSNSQSIEQITSAIKIVGQVKTQGGFLQQGVLRRLQINEPGESRYVVGIMKGLKSHLQKTREKMMSEEAKRKRMHEDLIRTKMGEINSLTEQKMTFQQQLTSKQVELVERKRLEKNSAQQINELTPIIKETDKMCKAKTDEYNARVADRKNEKEALSKAILEIKTYTNRKSAALVDVEDDEDAALSAAPSFVQESSEHRHHRRAHAVSRRQGSDEGDFEPEGAFDGAKKVVNELIAILLQQQADEKELKAYCTAELGKKEDEQTATQDTLKQLTAQIEMKDAEIETLKNEVDELYKTIETEKSQLEKADKLRKEAKQVFEAGTRDRALAVKVLQQAKAIVAEMLASPQKSKLVQTGTDDAAPPPETWNPAAARKDIASKGALAILDMVATDIAEEQKQAELDEKEAVTAYDTLKIENRENFDHMMEEVTERVKRKAKLTVQVGTDRETKQQQKDDLASIKKQLDSLHQKCDALLKEYDQREKKRKFELDQLRDVLDILSGSSVAARTSLLQQPAMIALMQNVGESAATVMTDVTSVNN